MKKLFCVFLAMALLCACGCQKGAGVISLDEDYVNLSESLPGMRTGTETERTGGDQCPVRTGRGSRSGHDGGAEGLSAKDQVRGEAR